MNDADRFKLLFGPYQTPRVRYGRTVRCQVRGEMVVCGLSEAPVPWTVGKSVRVRALIVYGALAKAVRRESGQAVARAWGVTPQTVTVWRKGLGGDPLTEGTRRLKRDHFAEPWAEETRRMAWAKAQDPERRAKISAAKKGVPKPRHVIEAWIAGRHARPDSAESRRRMSEAQKRAWVKRRARRGKRPENR